MTLPRRISEMKHNKQDIKMEQDISKTTSTLSFFTQEAYFTLPDITPSQENQSIQQLDKDKRLNLAMNDLRIGQRIYDELKRQGRSVTWLAQQLCMERTSLYYTFRQNSIDVGLLMRISAFVGHNFLQDVADMYKAYGL